MHEWAAKKLAAEAARIAGLDVVDSRGLLGARPVLDCTADIPIKKTSWLWLEKIPLGKLAVIAGDPGLGKSIVALDAAARVSTGRAWPDGALCEKGSVVLLSAEDDAPDTIVPRLSAAGADLTKVHILRAVRRAKPNGETALHPFSLQTDITALQAAVAELDDARLVVVDPLSSYLGSVDSHKNAEVRSVLAPLSALANDFHVTVLAVNHLNKSTGPALYRVIGSIAFTAAARAVWIVARSQDDPAERLLVPAKMNLAPNVEGFTFSLEDRAGVVTVRWGHAVNVAVDSVVGLETPDERTERAQAVDWIREQLADGPVPAADIEVAAKKAGLAWRTLMRAKGALGVESYREGFGTPWRWRLPADAEECQRPKNATVAPFANLASFEECQPPKNATKDATTSIWHPSQKTKEKKEEDHPLPKDATGVIEGGYIRDTEGPGVTCATCTGHYGTFAGWRAHSLRGRCYRPSEAIQ